jgi:hypothetical protein
LFGVTKTAAFVPPFLFRTLQGGVAPGWQAAEGMQ